MEDQKKFNYVMMSRADRERAIYINKLIQLKETLPFDVPNPFATLLSQTESEKARSKSPSGKKKVFDYKLLSKQAIISRIDK